MATSPEPMTMYLEFLMAAIVTLAACVSLVGVPDAISMQ